jgi:cytochrome c oxidase subunit 2
MTKIFKIMHTLLSLIFNPVLCDAPEPWQLGFQDGATPVFEGIVELHNTVFFYLVIIFVGVTWVMGSIIINFDSTKTLSFTNILTTVH